MAGCSALRAVLVLIALPLLIAAAPGAGAVIGPGTIGEGGTIFLNLTGVTNGTVLNTTLTAVFPPVPGVTWLNLTSWNYPFALQGGRLGAGGQNVNRLILYVTTGGASLTAVKTGAGSIAVEIPADIRPFTSYDFRIGYEVHNTTAPLAFTLYQQGMKAGPVTEANLTPSVMGVGEGKLAVAVFANGTSAGKQEVQVLKALPGTASAPVNATPQGPVNATASVTEIPAPSPLTPAASAPPTSAPATPSTSVALPRTSPPPVTAAAQPPASPATPSEAPGPSPFIIAFAAAIIIITVIADYILLKD